MPPKLTPSRRLKRQLDTLLPAGLAWSAGDQEIIELAAETADRVEVMRQVFAMETAAARDGQPLKSTRRLAEVSSELRALEKQLAGWIQQLEAGVATMVPGPPKSARHVAAGQASGAARAAQTAAERSAARRSHRPIKAV